MFLVIAMILRSIIIHFGSALLLFIVLLVVITMLLASMLRPSILKTYIGLIVHFILRFLPKRYLYSDG